VIIACPKCKTRYQVKDDLKADKIRCKKCQEVIVVKAAQVFDVASSAEAKTFVPNQAAASSASAKTVIPGQTPKSSEAKTVVPEKSAEAVPSGAGQVDKAAATRITSEREKGPAVAARATDESDPLLGKALGGYQILRKLGQGGMGAVYEARQLALDRSVALKVLPEALAANKTFILRFTREALSVAKLNHNNIVQIYDVGKSDGTYFFAMEFVRGTTLQKMVEKEGKLDIDTAVGYIVQAARGLEYAHRKKIVHRDVKPDNIMINEEGVAKVADLGLAKDVTDDDASMTMSGVGMGTPHYMAPEQATDAKTADARADIYSLGCTLYHLVTGRVPYGGSSAYEIITKHVNEPVVLPKLVNPDCPAELSDIIVKMMGKKKHERYSTMTEVIGALEQYLGVDFARKGFHPSEAQIQSLQAYAEQAGRARSDNVSRMALLGLSGIVALLILVGLFGKFRLLIGAVEFAAVGLITYGVFAGLGRKTYLYRRVRNYIFGYRLSDWLVGIIMLVVALALIFLLKLVPATISAVALGVAAGAGYYMVLKRPVWKRVGEVMEQIHKFARELRRKGIPEEQIHLFVCRDGGKLGEFLCEEMFGREALIGARARLTEKDLAKRPFGVRMREWVIRRLDAAEEKRAKGKEVIRPVAESAQAAMIAESAVMKTQVMPSAAASDAAQGAAQTPAQAAAASPKSAAPAGSETVAAEKFLDQLDHKPTAAGGFIKDLPGLIVGRKGRIAFGSILLLLSVLSIREMAFAGNTVLSSYNFALLSFAIILSGFARSKVFLAGIILCIGVCIVPFFLSDADSILTQGIGEVTARVPLLGRLLSPERVPEGITPPFIVGSVLLLLGFIGQFIWGDW
jgi:predicted Zn finger-like uncharacterized protein